VIYIHEVCLLSRRLLLVASLLVVVVKGVLEEELYWWLLALHIELEMVNRASEQLDPRASFEAEVRMQLVLTAHDLVR